MSCLNFYISLTIRHIFLAVLLLSSLFFLSQCGDSKASVEDPLYKYQWHLNDPINDVDVNAPEAWAITRGSRNIIVSVVDDGARIDHPDLEANHADRSLNVVDFSTNPFIPSLYSSADHGTAVSGLIVAEGNNGIGVSGVAPNARFFASNPLGSGRSTIGLLVLHKAATAVSNNSWGVSVNGAWFNSSAAVNRVITDGVENGFNGLGIVYVFAAGNGRSVYYVDPTTGVRITYPKSNANFGVYTKHYGVMGVCAVGSQGKAAYYSENGANLWVCGPSGGGFPRDPVASDKSIVTTDNIGDRGYNRGNSSSNFKDPDYTNSFSGTSASAPIVSGVVALVRSVDEFLSWRDVRLILALSAKKVDATDEGWFEGAGSYDGIGYDGPNYNHHDSYGFGLADAEAAVELVREWNYLPTMVTSSNLSQRSGESIPDENENGITSIISVNQSELFDFIEYVTLTVDIVAVGEGSSGDLRIELISPTGTKSILSDLHVCTNRLSVPILCGVQRAMDFGSARHLGENPDGVWSLRVADLLEVHEHRLISWSIRFRGHKR